MAPRVRSTQAETERGTGRTTAQLLAAPPASVFLVRNAHMRDYVLDLATKHGRCDVKVVAANTLEPDFLRGMSVAVVVDHDLRDHMNPGLYQSLAEYNNRRLDRQDVLAPAEPAADREPPTPDALRAMLSAVVRMLSSWLAERVRHKKRGTTYRVFPVEINLQSSGGPVSEGTMLTLYVSENDPTRWSVRPTDEFRDGRFEAA